MSSDEKRPGGGRRPRPISRPQLPPGPLADLKTLLYELYLHAGTPTLDQVVAWVAADEFEDLAGAPGRDTIARVIGNPALPPSQADVVAVATVLARAARWDKGDVAGRARELWVAAQLAASASAAAPWPDAPAAAGPGELLVAEADLRRLGVHAAITVPGVADEVPPEYVPRDVDDQVRARVEAAAQRGGFVLLVGESSVGKTRSAAEAIKAVLPDWRLMHPAGSGQVAALAAAPVPRTVVWLDELQRYLGGEDGLTSGVIRALLNPPHPAVIIATLWPYWYNPWTTPHGSAGPDSYAREREVLDLADVTPIAPAFSAGEQDRARAAADRDRRLAVALGTFGYELTQTLAAAPQLVARWDNADPYAWAVLTAALDMARFGTRSALTAEFLQAAAPGYCTPQEKAEAPSTWFEQALEYATGKLHGGAAALSPVAASMGEIIGYIPADYLIQHGRKQRQHERVPDSFWKAIVRHLPQNPHEIFWLGVYAEHLLLYRYAILLYRLSEDAGAPLAGQCLIRLLIRCGNTDGLRVLAAAGNDDAALELAALLAERGNLGELRAMAGAGHDTAALVLAGHLMRRGNGDELWARVGAGDRHAAEKLAELLTERGDVGGLRARADAGDSGAARQLEKILVKQADIDELRVLDAAGNSRAFSRLIDLLDFDELRARAEAGDWHASERLAPLLAEREDIDGLRALADMGCSEARKLLAEKLMERGDVNELRARAGAGDERADYGLLELLARRGDIDELRARADSGNRIARDWLLDLLVERGEADELWARTAAIYRFIPNQDLIGQRAEVLSNALIKQGRSSDAKRLRRYGLNPDGSIADAWDDLTVVG